MKMLFEVSHTHISLRGSGTPSTVGPVMFHILKKSGDSGGKATIAYSGKLKMSKYLQTKCTYVRTRSAFSRRISR